MLMLLRVKPLHAVTIIAASVLSMPGCGSEPVAPETGENAAASPSQAESPRADSAGAGAGAGPASKPTTTMQQARTMVSGGSAAPGAGGAGAAAIGGSPAAGMSAAAGGAAATSAEDAGIADEPATPTQSREPLSGRMYPITQEFIDEAPTFNVTRPSDLQATGGKLPVVVWANGGCLRSDFSWTPLFEHWAHAGFVVLSLTGTGGPDDLAGMLGSTTKSEHGALIDWVEKANVSGPLAGVLDLEHIVAAGNSCGGVTALELTAEDKRVAAVFVLSGSSAVGSVNTQVMQAITVPVGYITGSESEDVAAPNASGDYDAMQEGVPAMLVQRTMGDHVTVSTDAMILPQNAEIALNWLDLALYGTKQALDTLTAADKLCNGCTPGVWKLKAKHLESLVK